MIQDSFSPSLHRLSPLPHTMGEATTRHGTVIRRRMHTQLQIFPTNPTAERGVPLSKPSHSPATRIVS